MRFEIVVYPAEEGGFWAEVPTLPGCASQGETMEELEKNIKEAILGILAADEKIGVSGNARIMELVL